MFKIKKILTYSLLFVCAYNIWVHFLLSPKSFPQNSAYHDNLEIAESFYFDNVSSENLFLGSSISQSIIYDKIKNSQCVAFSGTSSLEGLSLLKHVQNKPKRVFIETNVLYSRGQNIVEDVVFLNRLKKVLPGLKQENKPLKIFMWGLLSIKDKIKSAINPILFSYDKKGIGPQRKPNKEKDKERHIIRHTVNDVDSVFIRSNLRTFEKEVSLLKNEGVEVFFLEIPAHEKIIYSRRHKFLIGEVDKLANKLDVVFLKFYDDRFDWTDGIHMTKESSKAFQEVITKRVEEIEFIN